MTIQALHDKMVGTSPVGHTLSRSVPIEIEITLTVEVDAHDSAIVEWVETHVGNIEPG